MSTFWSAQQQHWLTALGHTVYEQGQALPFAAPAARAGIAPPHRRTAPPPVAAVPGSAATPRSASRLPDKLHIALIRASGCNPNAAGAGALMAQWPAASALRGNAAAKRALWPQLRALRKPPVQ
ncbi:MAG: DNA polymerase III subunit psi [Pseudoxanthomonas sp.]|nr:DNA polymerase III subunit psi [Pseudoxanthomonas sp.]